MIMLFFFFNDTATTEIYTLSLHDALPIFETPVASVDPVAKEVRTTDGRRWPYDVLLSTMPLNKLVAADRKSTRLNSSHANISYAVFCLKKKKKKIYKLKIYTALL